MRRVLAVCMLASAMTAGVMVASPPAGAVAGFGDIAEARFFTEPVQWMVDNDITTGTSPTCFSPDDLVSRGQAAAFMWRMEGFPAPGVAHAFTDVVAVWQQDPVSWMFNNAITTGTTATTYAPDDTLTRGQLAALLYRLAGSPDPGPAHPFSDVVAPWQQDATSWMFNNMITTGTSPTEFSPDDPVTRGQLAAFFYRYKGSPPVVVDLDHPTSPACAAQVPGPTTGRLHLDKDTTLTRGHVGTFVIGTDNVTLDCDGFMVIPSGQAAPGDENDGILVTDATGVTVKNCYITGFMFNGITVLRSSGTSVVNNTTWGMNAGVEISYGSSGNTVQGNTAFDNVFAGFFARTTSSGNTVTGNTSRNNSEGFNDETIGAGTAGTANTYSQNTCVGNVDASIPPGLC